MSRDHQQGPGAPRLSVVWSRDELHLGLADVKHGQSILQERVAENKRPRSSVRDGGHAEGVFHQPLAELPLCCGLEMPNPARLC